MTVAHPSTHMASAYAYLSSQANQTSLDQLPILSSITENPNSDSISMIDAPLELVGAWKGSNCGLNDPEPVPAQLQMAENGVNIWSFADAETGVLMPQTGDGYEVIVGYQCIDVGRGYWWGQIPYSDVFWCNLFQVEEEDLPDGDGKVVRYTNLAYGGQGVGAVAQGACPTTLTGYPRSETSSMKPLQASFTRRLAATSSLARTCNVPAGSTDRVQPSHNSQFPAGEALPNPFGEVLTKTTEPLPALRTRSRTSDLVNPLEAAATSALPTIPTGLPVLNERTCRPVVTEETASLENGGLEWGSAVLGTYSSSAAWKPGFTLATVAASLLSWTML